MLVNLRTAYFGSRQNLPSQLTVKESQCAIILFYDGPEPPFYQIGDGGRLMRITKGDVVFQRNGSPAVVKDIEQDSRKVVLDENIDSVQKAAARGLKNNLNEAQREAFNITLKDVENSDKQQEISELYETIENLRSGKKTDPKVLRYLENELMHRMHRENFVPQNYRHDLDNFPQY